MKRNAMGIKVYGAGTPNVKENLALPKEIKLEEFSLKNSCRAHEGGCGSLRFSRAWPSARPFNSP